MCNQRRPPINRHNAALIITITRPSWQKHKLRSKSQPIHVPTIVPLATTVPPCSKGPARPWMIISNKIPTFAKLKFFEKNGEDNTRSNPNQRYCCWWPQASRKRKTLWSSLPCQRLAVFVDLITGRWIGSKGLGYIETAGEKSWRITAGWAKIKN